MHPMLIFACVGGLLVLIAWGLWALVRRWDRTNAILAAAPALPIRLLTEHDDAWIRGQVVCPRPVDVPFFGFPAVHFNYTLEEYVQRTRVDSKGRTTTEWTWETRDTRQGTAPFALEEEGHLMPIDAFRAEFRDEPCKIETRGRWRHTARFIPVPGEVSAVGVVEFVDNERTLTPYRHVPLIVTPRLRQAVIDSGEAWERNVYRVGLFILTAGFLVTFYAMGRFLQRPEEHFDLEREWWHSGLAVVAGLLTVAFTSSVWAMRTYNNLVTFRVRADQFWSSLDVNLKQRFDLVPNLVEVVKGYQQYEADLFAWIARLRSEALTGSREDRVDREGDCVAGVQRLLALEEAYPELKANTLYMRFHDQLVALEEKIAHARTVYNDAVAEFNREVHHFPSNLVARLTGFVDLPLFSAELTERASPQVRLDASESAGAASSDPSAIAAEDGRPGLGTTGVG